MKSRFIRYLSLAFAASCFAMFVACDEGGDGDETTIPNDITSVDGVNVVEISPGYYAAGIYSDEFAAAASPEQGGKQRQQNWCWAACIQMVLNYHGLYVTQEEIVEKVFGTQVDQPANASQILQALDGWFPDYRGRFSEVYAQIYNGAGAEIVLDLAYKWPLIVGLDAGVIGHAYVLTAVFYRVDANNNPVFDKVVVRDPWPGSASRQEMTWAEFQSRLLFMCRVYVVRRRLADGTEAGLQIGTPAAAANRTWPTP